nr:sorting nexin-19 [Biomphalaria glabrata]
MKVFQNDNIKKCLTVDEAFCKKVDFHYAVQSTSNEIKYMRGIVNLLLSSLAEPHLLHGISVKILLIEILTSKIFIPAINLISDPDWLLEAIILATSQKKIILNDDWNATEEPLKLNTKINEMVTNDKFSHHIYKLKEADLIGKADYHGNNLEYLDHLKSSESHLSAQNHSPVNTFLNNIDSEYLDQKYTSPKSHVELTTDLQKDNMNAQMFMDTPSNLTEINSSKLPLTALKENSDQQEDVIDGQQNTLSGVDPNSHYLPLHQVPSLLVEGEKSYLTTSDGIAVETSNSFPKHTLLKKRITDLKSSEPQQNIKNNKCLTLFTESSTLKKELESDLYTPEVLVDDVLVESTNLISPAYIETDLISSTGLASFLSLSSSTSQVFTSLIEYTDLKPLPRDMSLNWNDTTVSKDEIEQINPSISEDMRIFQDIAIPEAFPFRDEKSSSTYSLYTIEYEALYFTEEGKSVMRTGIVKRRYREFTNLQSRLEGQQAYKKYLKNLKVPKRWPTIPFKTLDKETVETRRIFLEKYLKDLITNEAICNGPDLREFLAYEGSSHIAFVKKSPDVLVPRIDKFLMRSVSGVMDRIKMIPNIPQEMISGLKGRDISDEKLACNKIQIDPDYIEFVSDFATEQFHEADPINILMAMCNQLVNDLKEVHLTGICEDQKTDQKAEIFKVEIEDIIFDLQTHITTQDQDSDKPKCSVVLELLALGLQDHWLCRDKVLKSLQLILAKILNGALQNTVTKFTTEDQIVSYLKHLREIVWPQGHFNFGNSSLTPDMQKAFVRVEAKKCLSNFLPKLLKSVIGIKQSEDMVDLFLNSIEKQQLNKNFLYTCMDVFIEELFPEITATDFLNMLFLQLEF